MIDSNINIESSESIGLEKFRDEIRKLKEMEQKGGNSQHFYFVEDFSILDREDQEIWEGFKSCESSRGCLGGFLLKFNTYRSELIGRHDNTAKGALVGYIANKLTFLMNR